MILLCPIYYFLINILERLYHNFYIEEPYDVCIKMAISGEFKRLLTYVNTHLDEKQTLDSLYSMFRIKATPHNSG